MKLYEIQNRFVEDAGTAAGTVGSSIAYTPVDVPAVHKELTKLSKKKKNWGVKIEEDWGSHRVTFENSLTINVPSELYEHFRYEIFGSKDLVESVFIANLGAYLFEAFTDEVEAAKVELQNTTVAVLNSPEVASQRHKVDSLSKDSGDSNLKITQPGKSVFSESAIDRQLATFLNFVDTVYNKDIGSLQLLTTAFEQKQPLTALPLFKNFANLVGNQLEGLFQGVPFVYAAQIDLNWVSTETLKVQNQQLVTRLKMNPMFREDQGILYPTSAEGFPTNLSELLTKYIRGA